MTCARQANLAEQMAAVKLASARLGGRYDRPERRRGA